VALEEKFASFVGSSNGALERGKQSGGEQMEVGRGEAARAWGCQLARLVLELVETRTEAKAKAELEFELESESESRVRQGHAQKVEPNGARLVAFPRLFGANLLPARSKQWIKIDGFCWLAARSHFRQCKTRSFGVGKIFTFLTFVLPVCAFSRSRARGLLGLCVGGRGAAFGLELVLWLPRGRAGLSGLAEEEESKEKKEEKEAPQLERSAEHCESPQCSKKGAQVGGNPLARRHFGRL